MKVLQGAVAGLMIAGMVACLAVIVHAGNELNREVGPNAMAVAPDGRLFVVSHDKVHVFTAENRRESVLDLKAMGAPRIPSDIAVHSTGRLYLADQEGARLVVCDIALARCGGQDLGLTGWTPEHLMPNNTFKFTLDEGRGRIYLSDNGGSRMLIADASGKVLARTPGDRSVVWFPNQVATYAPGEMTVVDTNHHRVATFDVSADTIGRVVRSFPIDAPGIAREKRAWPFALARLPDGNHWVAVAGDGMKDADVILYSPQGKALKRVDLGPRSDPWAIAAWNGNVVVGDARNYRLHAFAADGSRVREFGDPAFERELREREVTALAWRQYRAYAIVGVIAFPLVAIGLLRGMGVPMMSPHRRPIERPALVGEPAAPRELTWFAVDPRYVESATRQQRNAVIFMPVFLVVTAFIFFGMYGASVSAKTLWALGGIMGGMVLVLGAVLFHTGRGLRNRLRSIRLGVSPDGFHFFAPSSQSGVLKIVEGGPIAWRDVYFDGRRLLAGRQAFFVKLPTGAEIFERAAFEREILARIPKANFVGSGALAWRELKNASLGMQVTYGVGLGVALIMLILTFTRR